MLLSVEHPRCQMMMNLSDKMNLEMKVTLNCTMKHFSRNAVFGSVSVAFDTGDFQ